jgi:hypothetical protein
LWKRRLVHHSKIGAESGLKSEVVTYPRCADFVAEVRDYSSEAARLDFSESACSAPRKPLSSPPLRHASPNASHGLCWV